MGYINKTVTLVLEGGNPQENKSSCITLETYDKTPIFIPGNIVEDAVVSVAQKLLWSSGPGGMGLEAL